MSSMICYSSTLLTVHALIQLNGREVGGTMNLIVTYISMIECIDARMLVCMIESDIFPSLTIIGHFSQYSSLFKY